MNIILFNKKNHFLDDIITIYVKLNKIYNYMWFVHIPKTGGKSLKHFIERKKIKCDSTHFKSDFNRDKDKFQNQESCTVIIRDPIARYISEWCHYGITLQSVITNQNIIPFYDYVPFYKENNIKTVDDYLSLPETGNTQVKNILGYPLYSDIIVDESHIEFILEKIKQKKINVLIFEKIINQIPKYGEPYFPNKSELIQTLNSPEYRKRIEEHNYLDLLLYRKIVDNNLDCSFDQFLIDCIV